MENLKDKVLFVIGVIVLVAVCGVAVYLSLIRTTFCYTQIDNSRMSEVPSHKYQYHYELTAYDEHGKIQQVKFDTPRELREAAYLKLKTIWARGVVGWEEVQYDELPYDVKSRYPASD